MFAVDHAATALLVQRRYPSVPLAPILVSVQAMELAWVALNYLGIERTTTEAAVQSVADVHLVFMVSHLVLDLATHGHDIVLWPGRSTPKLGLGLYEAAPLVAFVVEFLYGIFCWYVYRGGALLFAVISLGNLANLSFLSPAIPGPEQSLAGHPTLLVTVILVQIVVTLALVGWTAGTAGRGSPTRP